MHHLHVRKQEVMVIQYLKDVADSAPGCHYCSIPANLISSFYFPSCFSTLQQQLKTMVVFTVSTHQCEPDCRLEFCKTASCFSNLQTGQRYRVVDLMTNVILFRQARQFTPDANIQLALQRRHTEVSSSQTAAELFGPHRGWRSNREGDPEAFGSDYRG